jgi:SAM-dependent methyltransferase
MPDPTTGSPWNEADDGVPPWEIGGPQPVIAALAELGLLCGRLLDVGCGSGEHTLLAAAHGASAVGLDIAERAIEQARAKGGERASSARFVVGDALALADLSERFDVVIDSGFFDTLAPPDRTVYAANLAAVVRTGGRVYLTTFSDQQTRAWPGPRLAPSAVAAAFSDGWTVEQISGCVRRTHRPESGYEQADAFLARIVREEASDDARRAPPLASWGPAPAAEPIESIELIELIGLEPNGVSVLDSGLAAVSDRSLYAGSYSLAVEGWAVPAGDSPVTVEVSDGTGIRHRCLANLPSPEPGARHPTRPAAATAGFQFVLGTLTLERSFELTVEAVGAGERRTTLGRIRGRREPLRGPYRPSFAPIMISTLGRSGSNWLLALLRESEEMAVASPWVQEPRVAHYWIDAMSTLTDPRSYMSMLNGQFTHELWWTGIDRQTPLPLRAAEPELARWLGTALPERLAGFAQAQIDAFYGQLATLEGTAARRFAEKWRPGPAATLLRELYPECHEVVLVRDFRDWVCSIEAYNARRGFTLWGAGEAEDDVEWFASLRRRGEHLLARWQPGMERTHLLRYEDLISRPEATLTDLCERLGLDAQPSTIARMLAGAAAHGTRGQQRHRTSSTVGASVGRWQREFSPERRAAAAAFDDLLVAFGYAASAPAAPAPIHPPNG